MPCLFGPLFWCNLYSLCRSCIVSVLIQRFLLCDSLLLQFSKDIQLQQLHAVTLTSNLEISDTICLDQRWYRKLRLINSLRQASLSRATKQLMPTPRGRRPPPPIQGEGLVYCTMCFYKLYDNDGIILCRYCFGLPVTSQVHNNTTGRDSSQPSGFSLARVLFVSNMWNIL